MILQSNKKQVNISGQYGKYNSNIFLTHPLDPFPSKMMRCPWILCFDLLPLQYTDLTHEKWWFLVFFISWSSYSFITQGLIAGWPNLEISSPKSAHLGILKVFGDFIWVFSRFPCQLRIFILKDFIPILTTIFRASIYILDLFRHFHPDKRIFSHIQFIKDDHSRSRIDHFVCSPDFLWSFCNQSCLALDSTLFDHKCVLLECSRRLTRNQSYIDPTCLDIPGMKQVTALKELGTLTVYLEPRINQEFFLLT